MKRRFIGTKYFNKKFFEIYLIGHFIKKGRKIWARNIVNVSINMAIRDLNYVGSKREFIDDIESKIVPILSYYSVVKGSVKFNLPKVVSESRGFSLGSFFIYKSVKERKKNTNCSYYTALSDELKDIYNCKGSAYNRKIEYQKKALNSRFVHFRSFRRKFKFSNFDYWYDILFKNDNEDELLKLY